MDKILTFCSAGFIKTEQCGLDFVEKLWESLRESLWEKLRKSFHRMANMVVLHILVWDFTHFVGFCGKISQRFYTRFGICKSGGFTHFPQGILLQLLNIL
jgi:hypothetical protein